ncbi:hypothetical protein R69746_05648 [Paraburkholderia aspalathi]|nr:hypothetical protein [Paraburkholderia aspalathi]MBK3841729.1 hypothetical protein [Paraburkholderia aspalathi]CAE6811638.1 hypothetical protein R69746_05648 [Paraburkholderia aspalathi]
MAGFEINISSNLKRLTRDLDDFAAKQVPFATAHALTALAKEVQQGEVDRMKATFRNPSPFTLKSVRTKPATKADLEAKVFVMDKASEYLQPYEFGGVHKLNSQALLNPKDINLNQYLQIPRMTLGRLKGRADIFIGAVETKHGPINGVWQRLDVTRKGKAKRKRKERGGVYDEHLGALKLLIRFGDALPVKQHLQYFDSATRTVNAGFGAAFARELAAAMATARR